MSNNIFVFGNGTVFNPAAFSASFNITGADLQQNGLDVDYTTHRTFSAMGILSFSTIATRAVVSFYNSMGVSKSISVYVNGSFQETRTASTDNAAYNEIFTFSAGAKTINFVLGTTDRTNDTGNIKTTTIRSVNFNAPATIVPWTKKLKSYVLLTDSIATGYALAEPARYAWPMLMRASHTDFDFTLMGYGGKRAYTAFNNSGDRTVVIAQLASLFSGVYEKRVYIELGANDYVTASATAAQVATAIGAFLDDLIAAFPDVQVIIQSPTTDTGESGTLETYRTAQAGLVTGRELWVTYIYGPSVASSSNYIDTVHLNVTGHAQANTYLDSRIFSTPAALANIIQQPTAFDNTYWDRSEYAVMTANTVVAPDGTTTAELAVPTVVSANHYLETNRSTANLLSQLTASQTYTLSVYAKPTGYKRLQFFFQRRDNTYAEVLFDLAAGGTVVESSGSPTSSGIKAELNGWYRCWMVVNVGTGSPANVAAGFKVMNNTATIASPNFSGDATSGIALWGAQINAGSVANTFKPYAGAGTTVGATTTPATTIAATTAPITTVPATTTPVGDPASISNLVGWWRSDSGVNTLSNNVWTDKTTSKVLSATGSSARPGFSASGGLNNQPYLSFDGTDDLISETSGLWGANDNITVVTVGTIEITRGRDGSGSGWSFIFPAYDDPTGRTFMVFTRTGVASHNSTHGINPPTQSSVKTCIVTNAASSGNSTIDIYNNAVLLGSTSIANGVFRSSGVGIEIGNHIGNGFLSGQISEIIIYNKKVQGTELDTLHNYLKTRYGV